MVSTSWPRSPTPQFFFNNVRFSMVLMVVVFHVSQSFANANASWYYVMNPTQSPAFDLFLAWCELFMMPTLFFVSGYFALPSFARHGVTMTLKGKLHRLGLPLVFGMFFVVPVLHYLWNFRNRQSYDGRFFLYWVHKVTDGFLHPRAALWQDMANFSPGYFWFLGVLLALFLLTGLLVASLGSERLICQGAPAPTGRIGIMLVVTWLSTSLGVGTINTMIPETSWFDIAPILEFQPTRLVIYTVYFSLGAVAWRQNWFCGRVPGSAITWIAAAIMLTVFYLWHAVDYYAIKTPTIKEIAGFTVLRCATCLAYLMALILGAQRFWNTETRLTRYLGEVSYDVYLCHYPIVVAMQLLVIHASEWTMVIKFIVASVVSIFVSHLACLMISKHPRTVAAIWTVATCVAFVVA